MLFFEFLLDILLDILLVLSIEISACTAFSSILLEPRQCFSFNEVRLQRQYPPRIILPFHCCQWLRSCDFVFANEIRIPQPKSSDFTINLFLPHLNTSGPGDFKCYKQLISASLLNGVYYVHTQGVYKIKFFLTCRICWNGLLETVIAITC